VFGRHGDRAIEDAWRAAVNSPDHVSNHPTMYGGHLFGTGVNVQAIRRSVDSLLESRLTNERSTQSALAETELYLKEIEGYFDETSHSSLNSSLGEFWNSWHDLSTSPLGASQRVQVYEQGQRLTQRFRSISGGLERVGEDLESELESAAGLINTYAEQLASLNQEIQTMEANHPANDLRDKQNQLINEMAKLINVDVITQGNGSLVVNVANGATLVSGTESNPLEIKDGRVIWKTSLEADITDDIAGGKMAGWLTIRDEVIPKYKTQLNELSKELIWNMNKINSQGVGQEFFKGALTGSYAADESGWLSSLPFGDRINYSNDFTMWVKDQSKASDEFHRIMFDMGISAASLSDFEGITPDGNASQYRFTVVDGAEVGDKIVTQINGDRIGGIWGSTAGTAATALDGILGNQLLTIHGSSGTHKIDIRDQGGDAKRSMADIAKALNKVPGVSAHASKTQTAFDLGGVTNAQDGDKVAYELYVDGVIHSQSFVRDSAEGSLAEQFETSLVAAAKSINKLNGDSDLYADGLELTSDRGATLGVQNFQVEDNAGVQLDTFTDF
ncbi:MAG: flagellar hook-associated protein FlgK, partial [Desulfovibrionales bacterium]|nr:flagellar hook-associated protein FlgK [Desulfovibrionales bacterium]